MRASLAARMQCCEGHIQEVAVEEDLFNSNHQLNYDEAMRRVKYWTGQIDSCPESAKSCLRILATLLVNNKTNLYFES
jgi:hypothetical protein